MRDEPALRPTAFQSAALVLLRTLVGWHFLYEGYYKAWLPAWSGAGAPLPAWSAASYLAAATGPLAGLFRALGTPPVAHWIDLLVVAALLGAGLSLILGLLTQWGAALALALLTLFYLAQVPLAGVPAPTAEGTYLVVDKTLVEWGAVLVLLSQRTGRLAGLDLFFHRGAPGRETRDAPLTNATAID